MIWLDSYERHARLAPGLLAVLPVAVSVIGFGLDKAPVFSSLVGLLSAAGGPIVLANTVRMFGLTLEARLYDQWGGRPTTRLLRLRDKSASMAQKAIWRGRLAAETGLFLPTRQAETRNPARADETYEALTALAREKTRDQSKFGMVFAENRSYGFERNMLGFQTVGIVVSALSLGLCLAALIVRIVGDGDVSSILVSASLVDVLIMLVWIMLPSKERVKTAAEKYAYQLLTSATS